MAVARTSWKKGQSGNPNGAPKRSWTWSGELSQALEESNETGESMKLIVCRALIKEAKKGNVPAIKILMERMDGLPTQAVEHNGEVDFKGVIVYKPEKNSQ